MNIFMQVRSESEKCHVTHESESEKGSVCDSSCWFVFPAMYDLFEEDGRCLTRSGYGILSALFFFFSPVQHYSRACTDLIERTIAHAVWWIRAGSAVGTQQVGKCLAERVQCWSELSPDREEAGIPGAAGYFFYSLRLDL